MFATGSEKLVSLCQGLSLTTELHQGTHRNRAFNFSGIANDWLGVEFTQRSVSIVHAEPQSSPCIADE